MLVSLSKESLTGRATVTLRLTTRRSTYTLILDRAERESAPPPGSVATDREILVALYNALNGPNWEDSENWLTDAPLGEWSSVTTDDNGRVIILLLGHQNSGQALNGEIPPELGNLASLQDLSLIKSKLTERFPRSWAGSPILEICTSGATGCPVGYRKKVANLPNLFTLVTVQT